MPSTTNQSDADQRREYAQGLRHVANLIESDLALPMPYDRRFLVPLVTNAAVEAYADESSRTVKYDDEGNASVDIRFGPVAVHVYGYVDFEAHCQASEARNAQSYADKHGLQLVPAEQVQA